MTEGRLLLTINVLWKQRTVGHRDAHMQYQTYSSFVIRLHCFSDVNIDMFDARSRMKPLY